MATKVIRFVPSADVANVSSQYFLILVPFITTNDVLYEFLKKNLIQNLVPNISNFEF